MKEENKHLNFRFRKIDETRINFSEQIKQDYLVSKSLKKIRNVLNSIKHLTILVSAYTGLVTCFAFASLVDISLGIATSKVELKFVK